MSKKEGVRKREKGTFFVNCQLVFLFLPTFVPILDFSPLVLSSPAVRLYIFVLLSLAPHIWYQVSLIVSLFFFIIVINYSDDDERPTTVVNIFLSFSFSSITVLFRDVIQLLFYRWWITRAMKEDQKGRRKIVRNVEREERGVESRQLDCN